MSYELHQAIQAQSSKPELPNAAQRFVLVHLHFSKPQQQKLDRKATKDAEDANGARGAIKASRYLYPKKFFDPILQVENQAREWLRSRTVELGDTGLYLLDVRTAMEAMQVLSEFETKRKQEVAVFGQNLGTILAEAQAQQGALFDPSVYPSVSEVTSQFTMSFTMLPMGELNGLANTLSQLESDIAETVKEHTEKSMREALAATVTEPLRRLVDSTLNSFNKMIRDDSRIHNSVFEDLDEITRLMPSLNVADNPKLNDLARLIRERVLHYNGKQVDADMVRQNPTLRKILAKNAEGIVKAMGIDTVAAKQRLSTSERRELSHSAADKIAEQMRGFF